MPLVLIRGGTIVTMNLDREVFEGDIWVEDDRITAVVPVGGQVRGVLPPGPVPERIIEAGAKVVIPGLVQTHVHLCQTLFRGMADDLELLDWLRRRIWPLEAAHDPESVYDAARLGIGELLRGGTTTILDMETVRHTESAFRAIEETGIRAIAGKVMMDHGDDLPPGLRESTADSLVESVDLFRRYNGAAGGRIGYAFSPRFAVSCSEPLLREVGELARQYGAMVHTHASENRSEADLVRSERGRSNVTYLGEVGLLGPRTVLAHCIWLEEEELRLLEETQTRVSHCPSSNLKLASGVAMIEEMLERGISVSIGADGAPCNNNLDGFLEMRLASLLQKVRRGPTALPALRALELMTIEGARALGLEREIGSLEPGKKADLAILDLQRLHVAPFGGKVASQLVYAAHAEDVVATMVDGRLLVEGGRLLALDQDEVIARARRSADRVAHRAQLS